MKKIYLFKIAVLNIYSQLWRVIFGVIGMIIALVVLVTLVSLGYGLDRIVTTQIKNEKASKLISVNSGKATLVKLDQETVSELAGIIGVIRINQIIEMAGKFSYNGSAVDLIISAVSPDFFNDSGIDLPRGVELMEASADEAQPVVITSSLAQLFNKQKPMELLGKEVFIDYILTKATSKNLYESDIEKKIIEGKKFRVLAIINKGTVPLVYIPHSFALANGVDYDTSSQAIIASTGDLEEVRAKIEAKGFSTENVSDYITEVHNFFGIFRLILVLISLTTIVVAIIGLLNMTDRLIHDRGKEFGWLKTIGMNSFEFRFLLSLEGALISIVSASIGIILGLFFSTTANIVIKIIANRHHYSYMPVFYTPVMLIIFLIIAAVVLGISIGFYSAGKAIKISPRIGVKK